MKILSLMFVLMSPFASHSQDTTIANLILVIDEQLVVGSISNIQVENCLGRVVKVSYCPGRLTYNMQDVNNLILNCDSLILAFNYYDNSSKRSLVYNYRLPFGEFFLKQEFLIVKVYNLDKKKYKKIFEPLDPKRNYTMEIIYPGGQIIRIKRRKKVSQ